LPLLELLDEELLWLEDELELLEEDEELLLELEEELELLLEELIVVPQFSTTFLTYRPEAVRSESLQLPKGFAPGTMTEEPSSLSLTAQLRWEILFCFSQAIHWSASPVATAPSPSAFTAPHSVTIKAIPLFIAVLALSRSHWPWVPA